MRTPRGGVRLPLGLLFVLTVLLAGAAIAWGSIPDSRDGRIYACYDFEGTGKGKMRVIDAEAGETCKATEKRLQWLSAEHVSAGARIVSPCGADQTCSVEVSCSGEEPTRVFTGGYDNVDNGTHVVGSRAAPDLNGWIVTIRNNQTPDTITVFAYCTSPAV